MGALDKLIKAVESGEHNRVCLVMGREGWPGDPWPGDWSSRVSSAFTGSLDAALALHEALLPGWQWMVEDMGCCVYRDALGVRQQFDGDPAIAARAWLLAILRAYRAQQEGQS